MNRFVLSALVVVLCGTAWSSPQADEAEPRPAREAGAGDPIEIGVTETATVRLLLLDVVVVDKAGTTVPDLTAEDFEILAGGEVVAVDTLDVDCPGGATEEPRAVAWAGSREATGGTAAGRKIVLALDYLHLDPVQRERVFDQAMAMVKHGAAAEDEVMLAALTGGLRIEQPFTNDREQIQRSLKRMRFDISLWNGNFFHLNENGFVDGLTALFDVLGTVPGPKAVMLYSGMLDVPLDLQFKELAAIASASRCSVYPVDAWGLRSPQEDAAVRSGSGAG